MLQPAIKKIEEQPVITNLLKLNTTSTSEEQNSEGSAFAKVVNVEHNNKVKDPLPDEKIGEATTHSASKEDLEDEKVPPPPGPICKTLSSNMALQQELSPIWICIFLVSSDLLDW